MEFSAYRGYSIFYIICFILYSCKVWRPAKHLCLQLIDSFFSVKATAFYNCNTRVKLDSCIFFTNAPRAEELLGKSCAQHKEALIAFYSAIQFFHSSPQALSSVSPSCLKSTLLLGIVCHLAICGHSASSFHCYINETNPCCVSDDVDMEKDDFTSLSGVGTNTRKLVKVGMFGP